MEREQPRADRAVLLFLKEAPHPADFTIREDRVVRTQPRVGKEHSVASRVSSIFLRVRFEVTDERFCG